MPASSDVRVAIHGASGRLGRLIVAEAGPSFVGPVQRTGPVPACDAVSYTHLTLPTILRV